jgi:hypothetical protein
MGTHHKHAYKHFCIKLLLCNNFQTQGRYEIMPGKVRIVETYTTAVDVTGKNIQISKFHSYKLMIPASLSLQLRLNRYRLYKVGLVDGCEY